MNLYEQLKSMIAAMHDMILPGSNQPAKSPTPQKKNRNPERQNHGQGESKARRAMAAKSKRRLVRLERHYRFLADESADNLRSRYHRIHRKVWMELEDRESKK